MPRNPRGSRKIKARGNRARPPNRGQIYGAAWNQLSRDVRYLMSAVNIEFKWQDVSSGAAVSIPNGIGIQALLNGTTLGNTSITRIGQSIKMQHVSLKLYMSIGAVASVAFLRVLLVWDHTPAGATFGVADLFQNAVTASDYTGSHQNVGNTKRFSVLFDRHMTMNVVSDSCHFVNHEMSLSSHTKMLQPASNAGTIADIAANALFLVILSNQAANFPTATYQVRIRWTDD